MRQSTIDPLNEILGRYLTLFLKETRIKTVEVTDTLSERVRECMFLLMMMMIMLLMMML